MTQKQTIAIFAVLCLIALGLGYWVGQPEKAPAQNTQAAPPMITTNVVTNVAGVQPNPKPADIVTDIDWNPIVEKAIRESLENPRGELTKADLEKVTALYLHRKQLAKIPAGLENLTQLEKLYLNDNQLTDAKDLENLTQLKSLQLAGNMLTRVNALGKLTQLEELHLKDNPDLTKAQIAELKKALPKCTILSNPTK